MNILCQMFKQEVNNGRQMIIVAHNVDSEYLPNNKQYLTEPKLMIFFRKLKAGTYVCAPRACKYGCSNVLSCMNNIKLLLEKHISTCKYNSSST